MQQATKAKVYILPKYNIGNISRNPRPKAISTVSNERIQQHTNAIPPRSSMLRLTPPSTHHPFGSFLLPCFTFHLLFPYSTFLPIHPRSPDSSLLPHPPYLPCLRSSPRTLPQHSVPPLPLEHRKEHGISQPRAIIVKISTVKPSIIAPQYNKYAFG